MENFIHETSNVKNCKLYNGVAIYRECKVIDSLLENNASIGDYSRVINSSLEEHVLLQRNNLVYNTSFGRYTYTGRNCTFFHCCIGKFCSISFNVVVGGGEHPYRFVTDHAFLYSKDFDLMPEFVNNDETYNRFSEPCVIGNDVWVAANAVILRGVNIGDGAVIGAGAVVTKDVPPYSIVGGVPAKIIKQRFDDKIVERLLKIKWWNLPSDVIKQNFRLFNSEPSEELLDKIQAICH